MRKSRIWVDKIIKEIDRYNYVSFDIFDTLIKRDVPNPRTIFVLMEGIIKCKFGLQIENFFTKRIEAERKARSKSKDKEISIRHIYESAEDPEIRKNAEKIIRLEKELELVSSHPNYPMQAVYTWCIKNDKKVVFTSDMYLEEEFISLLLDKNGYKVYERIFISSEFGKRKADNGALFEVICSDLQIQPGELIHIGDSKNSDGKMPRKIGCKSVIIPRKLNNFVLLKNTLYRGKNLQYKILNCFCENRLLKNDDYFYSFGYEAFGPLLVGFSKWLYSEIKKEKIKHIYFFSRDGLIIKKVFDQLYDNDSSVITHYLMVSRRSLRVPQIWMHPEYVDVIKTFPEASMQNIATFFDVLGLDFKNYSTVCSKFEIDEQYNYKKGDMAGNKELAALYEEVKCDVINNSKKEYYAFQKYMDKIFSDEKVAVVDIGWRGSIQKFLMELCNSSGIDVKLFGYYVGLAHGARKYLDEVPIKFKGYLFDCVVNPKTQDIRNPFVGLIETLFLGQEGSTKRYIINDIGMVDVEFYDNEYVTEEGNLTIDAQKVVRIQNGGLQFVKDYKESVLAEMAFDSDVLFKKLYKVGTHPSLDVLNHFGDMKFCDGGTVKLAAPKSIMSYCINPKSLIRDFYNSRWKIGFLKRLCKIPLPYNTLYKILKRI